MFRPSTMHLGAKTSVFDNLNIQDLSKVDLPFLTILTDLRPVYVGVIYWTLVTSNDPQMVPGHYISVS